MSQFSFINGLANLWNNTSIPSRLLSAENQLTFDFQYGLAVDGGTQANCKSVTLIPNQVEIDPNSTIDFSGFYHFARLPDLKLFTVSGYPFTKYADLSQTLVLMKKDAPANVMTTMLNTMGRFGAQTVLPSRKLRSTLPSRMITLSTATFWSLLKTAPISIISANLSPRLFLKKLKAT